MTAPSGLRTKSYSNRTQFFSKYGLSGSSHVCRLVDTRITRLRFVLVLVPIPKWMLSVAGLFPSTVDFIRSIFVFPWNVRQPIETMDGR